MRRDKPRPRTFIELITRGKTLPVPPTLRPKPGKSEAMGPSDSRAEIAQTTVAPAKPPEVKNLFTMSKNEARDPRSAGNGRRQANSFARDLVFGRRRRRRSRDRPHDRPARRRTAMVEAIGIEPTTFCLQSRCSPN